MVTETEPRLLTLAEVSIRVGLKRTSIYRLMTLGEFPAQRKIGKASRWLAEDIEGWINGLPRGIDP